MQDKSVPCLQPTAAQGVSRSIIDLLSGKSRGADTASACQTPSSRPTLFYTVRVIRSSAMVMGPPYSFLQGPMRSASSQTG